MLELFTSESRLYSLAWHDDKGPEMAVEAWWGREELSGGFEYIIDLLATDACIPDGDLMGAPSSFLPPSPTERNSNAAAASGPSSPWAATAVSVVTA